MNFELYKNNNQIKNVLTEIDEYAEFMKMCVCLIAKNEAFKSEERTAIKSAYEAVANSLKRNMEFIFNRPLSILGKSFTEENPSNLQSSSPVQANDLRSNEEARKVQ